jgi:hypothetical protein
MSINIYDRVQYIGTKDYCEELEYGAFGTVVEDYKDGNYEVDFSTIDGTTDVVMALPEKFLRVVGEGEIEKDEKSIEEIEKIIERHTFSEDELKIPGADDTSSS